MKTIFHLIIALLLSLSCTACSAETDKTSRTDVDWNSQRERLVQTLKAEGITDSRVLDAVNLVPRHEFVPKMLRAQSYANHPLPIGRDQTISQPYIVAYMCQELQIDPSDVILEIGTGSGYHAAVMSLLAKDVYTIEIIAELGNRAAEALKRLDYTNIEVRIGDGYKGWPEAAPFDCIILTAAPPEIPKPLLEQMKVGGRLIAPVGEHWQELVLVTRSEEGYSRKRLIPVRFVPMTGEAQQTETGK